MEQRPAAWALVGAGAVCVGLALAAALVAGGFMAWMGAPSATAAPMLPPAALEAFIWSGALTVLVSSLGVHAVVLRAPPALTVALCFGLTLAAAVATPVLTLLVVTFVGDARSALSIDATRATAATMVGLCLTLPLSFAVGGAFSLGLVPARRWLSSGRATDLTRAAATTSLIVGSATAGIAWGPAAARPGLDPLLATGLAVSAALFGVVLATELARRARLRAIDGDVSLVAVPLGAAHVPLGTLALGANDATEAIVRRGAATYRDLPVALYLR